MYTVSVTFERSKVASGGLVSVCVCVFDVLFCAGIGLSVGATSIMLHMIKNKVPIVMVSSVFFIIVGIMVWGYVSNPTVPIPIVAKQVDLFFAEPTITPASQTYHVVPVTAFDNFAVQALEHYEEEIYAMDPVDGFVIEQRTPAALDAFLLSPSKEVWFVPVNRLSPQVRVLSVAEKLYWDAMSDWSITATHTNQSITVPTQLPEFFEMIIAGTVVLSRGVAERINVYSDATYPWQEVQSLLSQAEYALVNFKGAITSDCEYDGDTLRFCGSSEYLEGMTYAGVDGVSLSGNHIGDYGQVGLAETLFFLQEESIDTTGLGKGFDAAVEPILVKSQGETIAVLAFNNVPGTSPCASETTDNLGITCLFDETLVAKKISELKGQGMTVIVIPNWGKEYTRVPDHTSQVMWAELFVQAGADVIIGDQAHWIQAFRWVEGIPVYYGVGNFIFDQMWSEETTEGIIVRLFFMGNELIGMHPVPIKIYDYAQPRVVEGDEGKRIVSYLLSSELQ